MAIETFNAYVPPPITGAAVGLIVVQALGGQLTLGNNTWTQSFAPVGSGNSLVIASWARADFGAPTVITDSAGGVYELDYTATTYNLFTTRYYRRTNITNAPSSVTVTYGPATVDSFSVVLEIVGEIAPEQTVSGTNGYGAALTIQGAATTDETLGLGSMHLGNSRTITVDPTWTRLQTDSDPRSIAMLYKRNLGAGTVGFTNTFAATNAWGSVVTYAATLGDNATRISNMLAGRSPHFAYSTPADPVTTREVTVTNATSFNTEAAVNGTKIFVNSSFSGNIEILGSDIDIVMSNTATITGNLSLGNGSRRATRVRWTGGNVAVGHFWFINFSDALFDDFTTNTTVGVPMNIAAGGRAWNRLAFINTTLSNQGGNYAIYTQETGGNSDLIIGNVKVLGSPGLDHVWRLMNTDNVVVFDTVSNPDGNSSSAMRFHHSCQNVWIQDTWARGAMHMNGTGSYPTGPDITNGLFVNFDRYAPTYTLGQYAFGSSPGFGGNTGEIINSALYRPATFSTTVNIPGFSDGGGNTAVNWNEIAVPDYSLVGAIR